MFELTEEQYNECEELERRKHDDKLKELKEVVRTDNCKNVINTIEHTNYHYRYVHRCLLGKDISDSSTCETCRSFVPKISDDELQRYYEDLYEDD